MDPVMFKLWILQPRWYGFFIAMGVLIGVWWAGRIADRRGLDSEKLLDMVVYCVIAGIIGARLVYVLTSPSQFFGEGGNLLDAFKVWQGGISIHGGTIGIVVAVAIYSRIHKLNMWQYLDVASIVGPLGIIGGRLGNFMNGSDTTGRLTGWPIGYTWPDPGTESLGTFGNFFFTNNMWAAYPGTCSLGSEFSLSQCFSNGGAILRGPVHLTQMYGVVVGIILLFILLWAYKRSNAAGFVWWQFVLWYSVLRSVLEETFRDNPLFWNVYLSEGIDKAGIGFFTLTQLVSIPIILVALYMLFTLDPDSGPKPKAVKAS